MSDHITFYKVNCHRSYRLSLLKKNRMPLSPISIGLSVWVLGASSSSCLACANGTCHEPFSEHQGIDTTTFPSFVCVERRRFGPNRISRSASKRNFVKPRATCHRHAPPGTDAVKTREESKHVPHATCLVRGRERL